MSPIPYTITLVCMEPSRPAMVGEIVSRMNCEKGLPLAIMLHAFESAGLADAGRQGAIGAAIAASDLVIISHVLLDEEVEPLLRLVAEHARGEATVIGISSAAPLMRLTKIGRFAMGSRKSGIGSRKSKEGGGVSTLKTLLKRITGDRDITPYLKELMVLAPKLLRLIPGRMQDLRSYLESYLYFVECSAANIRSMFLMLADRYHGPLRGALAGAYDAPILYPAEGIYHPDAHEPFASREEYLRWYRRPGSAMVGLILLRGDVLMGETAHIDAIIRTFERRGIGVTAAFSSSFDYRAAVEKMMLDPDGRGIDALVSLTAFPLVGGHVRSDLPAAVGALERWNVPYFSPIPLLFQTVEEWKASPYGLSPVQTALHVALPELEGAIEPIVASGVEWTESGKMKRGIEERCERLARRVEHWIALRRRDNHEKRVAITIFSFPPGKGAVGTAAYLDLFRSLYNTLLRLHHEGYSVELPASPEEMIEQIVIGEEKLAAQATAELNVAGRLSVDDYLTLAPDARRAQEMWGPPPGALNSDGRDILIYGRAYGNIFIGVQPTFGFEGDPMRLLFAQGATPHHGFLGYYTWVEKIFGADVHLHFGTHGALEFMPGKQVGLDRGCWPDLLIGERPHLYLYSINNPSEGTIAKRRSLGTLVSYLTPPLENAGLYRELATLRSMVASYREAPPGDARRELTLEALIEKVDQLHLEKDVPPPRTAAESDGESFVARLHAHLIEIESRLIPTGLHIVGEIPEPAELTDLLLAVSEYDRPEHAVRSLTDIIASSFGIPYHELYRRAERGDEEAIELYNRVRRIAREGIGEMVAESEVGGRRSGVDQSRRVGSRESGVGGRKSEVGSREESAGYLSPHRAAAFIERALATARRTSAGGRPLSSSLRLPTLRLPTSDSRRPTSDSRRPTSDSRRPTSDSDRLPTPDSELRTLLASLSYLATVARWAIEDRELDMVVQGLAGAYIPPGIGGDPVRNPEALPSGRNIHALDPAAVPSAMAVRNGRRVAAMMLEKHREEHGAYPESIGMVLWGLDNIKTQGEAIAQVLALIGVEPEPNGIGRVSRLRVIPLEELGRPRIDVTIEASGIFRDIFGLQIDLLDEAIRRVAALDEPETMNFVRRRTLNLMATLGVPESEAATRIFCNDAGAYGANVDHMVGMSTWQSRDDLAEVFTRRKSFAYGKGFRGRESRPLFEALASEIDLTVQNLDSSEVGITDVDHYFEYLGGFTNVVRRLRGRAPAVLVADTTTARAKVRTLEATIRLEVRTKLLNPKWFEGMLAHGYQGVEEIRKRLDYTFGFSATAGAVDPWVYEAIHDTYCADRAMRERMRGLNIHAYEGIVRRLLEAEERGFWSPAPEAAGELHALRDEIEDRLEGIE